MSGHQAIGIDIGSTGTRLACVTSEGEVLREEILEARLYADQEAFLELLVASLEKCLAEISPRGIGLALPTFRVPLEIGDSPDVPKLSGLDYQDVLQRFNLPVKFEQDLNALALAEYFLGEWKTSRRLMAVSLGNHLGAAVILDGQLLRFNAGAAGNNGHIILEPGGPSCSSGCLGCAEALIAAPAIERLAIERVNDPRGRLLRASSRINRIPARVIITSATHGDPLAGEIMTEIGAWLGQWLASLAPIYTPDQIVLSGGVAEAGPSLLEAAQLRFRELTASEFSHCAISISRFGSQAGVIGATAPFFFF